MVAVKEANPLLDIRFVFQNARVKLSRNSDTSYGEWAEKKGFLWAHQSIPEEWIQ